MTAKASILIKATWFKMSARIYIPAGEISFILYLLISYSLPPCWIYWLSSPGRIAPRRSRRSCGGSPCTAPEHNHQQCVTVDPEILITISINLNWQSYFLSWWCIQGLTCSSCMLLGMDTGGQLSAMYLALSSSRSLSSSSSKPLAMDSIKLCRTTAARHIPTRHL